MNFFTSLLDYLIALPAGQMMVSLLLLLFFLFIAIGGSLFLLVKIGGATKLGSVEFGKKVTKNSFKLIQYEMQLFDESRELAAAHERIACLTLVREQMILVEGYLDEAQALVLQCFGERVKLVFAERSSEERLASWGEFERSLLLLEQQLKNVFRNVAKENHLAEKTEREFELYIKKKLVYLKTVLPNWFLSVYLDGPGKIPSQDLVKHFPGTWTTLEQRFEKALIEMREISIKYKSLVLKEQNSLMTKRVAFFSAIPTILSGGDVDMDRL